MSMGPSEIAKVEETPVIRRFSASAKKAVEQYFTKPAHYLFYLLLTLGAIALLVGQEPPIKFWILLAFIGLLNLYPRSAAAPEAEKPLKSSKTKSDAKRK